jgi:hypothetical protein
MSLSFQDIDATARSEAAHILTVDLEADLRVSCAHAPLRLRQVCQCLYFMQISESA